MDGVRAGRRARPRGLGPKFASYSSALCLLLAFNPHTVHLPFICELGYAKRQIRLLPDPQIRSLNIWTPSASCPRVGTCRWMRSGTNSRWFSSPARSISFLRSGRVPAPRSGHSRRVDPRWGPRQPTVDGEADEHMEERGTRRRRATKRSARSSSQPGCSASRRPSSAGACSIRSPMPSTSARMLAMAFASAISSRSPAVGSWSPRGRTPPRPRPATTAAARPRTRSSRATSPRTPLSRGVTAGPHVREGSSDGARGASKHRQLLAVIGVRTRL